MEKTTETIPLFPLNTVLFPGGPLPLRIFEPRYLDMISECMKGSGIFGISLIKEGKETGKAAETYSVGTIARIVDWEDSDRGVLGVTVVGEDRFKVLNRRVEKNNLIHAEIERLPEEAPAQLPDNFFTQVVFLQQMVQSLNQIYRFVSCDFEEAGWVSYRLAEFLPLTLKDRQSLLEVYGANERLAKLLPWLEKIKWT